MDPRLLGADSAMELSPARSHNQDDLYVPTYLMREWQEQHNTPVLSSLTTKNVQILSRERHDIMERFMTDVIDFMRDTNEKNMISHYSVLFTEAGCSIVTPKNCEGLDLFYTI